MAPDAQDEWNYYRESRRLAFQGGMEPAPNSLGLDVPFQGGMGPTTSSSLGVQFHVNSDPEPMKTPMNTDHPTLEQIGEQDNGEPEARA